MCTAVPRPPSHRRRARAQVSEIVRHVPVPTERLNERTKDEKAADVQDSVKERPPSAWRRRGPSTVPHPGPSARKDHCM